MPVWKRASSRSRFSLASWLQWGHTVAGVEKTSSRIACHDRGSGFNGATPLPVWKRMGDRAYSLKALELQWGHTVAGVEKTHSVAEKRQSSQGFNGATPLPVWKSGRLLATPLPRRDASMGPHRCRCGKGADNLHDALGRLSLQWGHTVAGVEKGHHPTCVPGLGLRLVLRAVDGSAPNTDHSWPEPFPQAPTPSGYVTRERLPGFCLPPCLSPLLRRMVSARVHVRLYRTPAQAAERLPAVQCVDT